MMLSMSPTRERILDAYEAILGESGERRATMDAIAARAHVSKGGLIYHFASKEALVEGICGRLTTLVDQDVEVMRQAPEGAARYYVRASTFTDSPLDRALLAAARLQDAGYEVAREAASYADKQWLMVLREQIPNPHAAYAIKLIGDGLYFENMFTPSSIRTLGASDHESLLAVVDHLTQLD